MQELGDIAQYKEAFGMIASRTEYSKENCLRLFINREERFKGFVWYMPLENVHGLANGTASALGRTVLTNLFGE